MTGGASGIGRATAMWLIAEEANVAVPDTNALFVAPIGADLITVEIGLS